MITVPAKRINPKKIATATSTTKLNPYPNPPAPEKTARAGIKQIRFCKKLLPVTLIQHTKKRSPRSPANFSFTYNNPLTTMQYMGLLLFLFTHFFLDNHFNDFHHAFLHKR